MGCSVEEDGNCGGKGLLTMGSAAARERRVQRSRSAVVWRRISA